MVAFLPVLFLALGLSEPGPAFDASWVVHQRCAMDVRAADSPLPLDRLPDAIAPVVPSAAENGLLQPRHTLRAVEARHTATGVTVSAKSRVPSLMGTTRQLRLSLLLPASSRPSLQILLCTWLT